MKYNYLFVIMSLLLCTSTVMSKDADPRTSSTWCAVNPANNNDRGPDDWIKLEKASIHVVRGSMQKAAGRALSRKNYVHISVNKARNYISDREAITDINYIYLVKSASLNVAEDRDSGKIIGVARFQGYFSPSRNKLEISDPSLSHAGMTPSNLALVIESRGRVLKYSSICLTAE